LLALPPLFLCSAPGYHPLVNFCLLVGRKHLENLARLKTLQALERHVLLALGQPFVFDHRIPTQLCFLTNLSNLGFLAIGKRQPSKIVYWASVTFGWSRR